jgi:hypothetical protein
LLSLLNPGEIDGRFTLPGVGFSVEFGRGLGAMSYIAFVLGRALTVAMVAGLSLLLLIAIVSIAAVFVLYS